MPGRREQRRCENVSSVSLAVIFALSTMASQKNLCLLFHFHDSLNDYR